jgi:hypothetical protein
MPKRPRSFKFVSGYRRTCSLSNAAENVQHRNFVAQENGRDGALRRPLFGDFGKRASRISPGGRRSAASLP